jgi:DNA primase
LDAKEQVRQAVDIVDLVGDYLQLRREGRGYKALCPWHNDSRPSLQVNPERQSFRCWVCDIGGDIFSFMMKMEGVAFPEALAMLAERAGITLDSHSNPDAAEAKRLYFQAMAWAEQQYHDCLLKAPEAQAARDYLADRNITAETISAARLGYAPEAWDWILQQARETRYTPKVLEAVGLVGQRSTGTGYYDRFRGRVLFSIHDPQGRPVGVGGRVLPGTPEAERGPKYVNSPETPLFSKSSLLYGLDVAKDTMAKTRTAIVMEGYTDCLIARQFGFANAVAVLGTALGERHIKLLRRFVDTIVLVLDGDEAGRRRTEQVLELFVAEQMDLRVLTLPDELDPAEFLLERGAGPFQELLDSAVDALEHRYSLAMTGIDADSGLHTVLRAVESVLATLAKSPRLQGQLTSAVQMREDQILHRLAQRSGLEDARLRQRLAELRRTTRRSETRTPEKMAPTAESSVPAVETSATTKLANETPITPKQTLAERWLLELILEQPDLLAEARGTVGVEHFRCPRRQALYAACCRLADAGIIPSFERLMLEFDEPDLKGLLVELDEERQAKRRTNTVKELRELLVAFRDEHGLSAHSLSPARQDEDDLQRLQKLVQQKRSRQGISVPTDG